MLRHCFFVGRIPLFAPRYWETKGLTPPGWDALQISSFYQTSNSYLFYKFVQLWTLEKCDKVYFNHENCFITNLAFLLKFNCVFI
ncbi:unnamed protein product [Coffea canephora]|uniref:Uncharacterized protein n=1 Tax=Coffea canephora TaxID=49390 RepID=A0A068V2C7_COFCA|nr:unnamed protein product [Coffea canephora]